MLSANFWPHSSAGEIEIDLANDEDRLALETLCRKIATWERVIREKMADEQRSTIKNEELRSMHMKELRHVRFDITQDPPSQLIIQRARAVARLATIAVSVLFALPVTVAVGWVAYVYKYKSFPFVPDIMLVWTGITVIGYYLAHFSLGDGSFEVLPKGHLEMRAKRIRNWLQNTALMTTVVGMACLSAVVTLLLEGQFVLVVLSAVSGAVLLRIGSNAVRKSYGWGSYVASLEPLEGEACARMLELSRHLSEVATYRHKVIVEGREFVTAEYMAADTFRSRQAELAAKEHEKERLSAVCRALYEVEG